MNFTKYISNSHEDSPRKIKYLSKKTTTLYINSKYKHYHYAYAWHLSNKHDTRNHILIEYLYVNVVGLNPPPSSMNEYRYIIVHVYTVIYRQG